VADASAVERRRRPTLLGRLLTESATYGLGGVANQALAIILVPIYARQLGVANYGLVAIINTTLSLTAMVITLALPQAFFRSYLKEAADDRARAAVLRTTLGLRLAVSVGGLALYSILAFPLTALIFGGTENLPLMLLIGPVAFFDSLNLVPLSFLRAQRRPRAYATLSFSRALLGGVFIVALVVGADLGVLGVIVGSLASSVLVAGAGLLQLRRAEQLNATFDRRLVRHMLNFSLPLVPASVAAWTLNLSDRYIIQAVDGTTAVGVYSGGYTVGLIINALAVAPFTLAWGAAYWELARVGTASQSIPRVMTGYLAFASLVALALSALGTDAIRLLLTPAFEPGRFVVPFSAFAYVLYGAYTIGSTGLNLASQTRWVPLAMIVAAVSNVVMNLVLIPPLGYMGAAVSTLVGYGLLALVSTAVSQRFYPIGWDLPRNLGTLAIGLALAAAALLGPDHVGWRILCLAAYPPTLLALGIVRRADLASLRRLLPQSSGPPETSW
jgi:O-antigen/teichoic acid export membrane protein